MFNLTVVAWMAGMDDLAHSVKVKFFHLAKTAKLFLSY